MLSKVFGQYRAELEPNDNRPGFSVIVTHWPTRVANSLPLLRDMGAFDEVPRDRESPVHISDRTLDQIEEWANANGYNA